MIKRVLSNVWILLVCAVVVIVVVRGRSGLNGTWIKQSGDRTIPDEITIKVTRNQFKERWFDGAGVSTITVLCDGAEHSWSSADVVKITYRAVLKGNTFLITKRMRSPLGETAYTERWAVNENSHTLVVTGLGPETVFERRPLLASLFSGTP